MNDNRLISTLTIITLLTAGCGGGGGDHSEEATPPTQVDYDLPSATNPGQTTTATLTRRNAKDYTVQAVETIGFVEEFIDVYYEDRQSGKSPQDAVALTEKNHLGRFASELNTLGANHQFSNSTSRIENCITGTVE